MRLSYTAIIFLLSLQVSCSAAKTECLDDYQKNHSVIQNNITVAMDNLWKKFDSNTLPWRDIYSVNIQEMTVSDKGKNLRFYITPSITTLDGGIIVFIDKCTLEVTDIGEAQW